jgi:predicted kinase
MLGGDYFTRSHALFEAVYAYDTTPIRQCHARNIRRREVRHLPAQLVIHATRQRGIHRDQKRHGIGIMLRLREEVCSDEAGIGARVGEHDQL